MLRFPVQGLGTLRVDDALGAGTSLSRGDNMVERDMGDNSQMFIDGYFSCLLSSGHRPNYGYPQNHLPDVREHEVRVRPGFKPSTAR
ncbi:MAG TPA: hypothetical protein DIT64_04055 [Verrucomicrobiales bacterium]|nr:hypothetical protein [Verrucomicrobiales bacterium]